MLPPAVLTPSRVTLALSVTPGGYRYPLFASSEHQVTPGTHPSDTAVARFAFFVAVVVAVAVYQLENTPTVFFFAFSTREGMGPR